MTDNCTVRGQLIGAITKRPTAATGGSRQARVQRHRQVNLGQQPKGMECGPKVHLPVTRPLFAGFDHPVPRRYPVNLNRLDRLPWSNTTLRSPATRCELAVFGSHPRRHRTAGRQISAAHWWSRLRLQRIRGSHTKPQRPELPLTRPIVATGNHSMGELRWQTTMQIRP